MKNPSNFLSNLIIDLKPEDTFRILDADFDGAVGKTDLLRFINEILEFPIEEVTQSRVSRLFKLLDVYKRGRIQLSDITALLKGEGQTETILRGGNEMNEKTPFDWRLHARQQIGLALSAQFHDIKLSFEGKKSPSEKLNKLIQ